MLVESSPPVLSRRWGWKEEEEGGDGCAKRGESSRQSVLGSGGRGERSVQGVGRYGKLGENCNKLSFAAQYSFSSAQ